MTDPALRERAALDVLGLLPEWWQLGPASYDPGTGRWTITARGPHPGRGKVPETLTGRGEDELAAFADLRILLDERGRAGNSRRSTAAVAQRSSRVLRSGHGALRGGRSPRTSWSE